MPRKPTKTKSPAGSLNFTMLVDAVRQVHAHCSAQASRAVNVSLTLRNWAIGCYIREYEQNGTDRAKYGDGLLESLAARLLKTGMERMDARELRRYRQFFLTYPKIWESLTPEFRGLIPGTIMEAVSVESISVLQPASMWQALFARSQENRSTQIRESVTPELGADGHTLINRLSFTHIAELIAIDDRFKRAFYEIECIRGNWSVCALKRQIATLYFERSGLSTDKDTLAALAHAAAEKAEPKLAIRDPYVFEFLGLRPKEAVSESDLEDSLLDKLQEFLLFPALAAGNNAERPRFGRIRSCRHRQPPVCVQIPT